MSQIEKDLNAFYTGLCDSKSVLQAFSDEFESRLTGLQGKLEELNSLTQDLLNGKAETPVQKLLEAEIGKWQQRLTVCKGIVQENVRGHEFQNRFQKQALIIVFGIVKAGKSTLGNFIHGKAFRNAPFDNVYKSKLPKSRIIVEEQGRKDVNEKEQFDENSIESTCSAQYFELPGMVWVDTPGIGAIEQKTDIRPLEQIAQQYVQYADLVIFLSSSASPGVKEDIENYKRLYLAGKRALIIITRSDTSEIDFDENGNRIQCIVPKDPERRRRQEEYLLKAMVEQGIESKDISAISISTRLAENGIAKMDDALWAGSNMGLLFRKITDVIGNELILELKKENPRQQLNSAINAMLSPDMEGNSLLVLRKELQETRMELKKRFDSLAPEGDLVQMIVDDVTDKLRGVIRQEIDSQRDESGDRFEVSLDGLAGRIEEISTKTFYGHVSRIIGEYNKETVSVAFRLPEIKGTVEKEKKTIKRKVTVSRRVEREPDGLWELFQSFFGKKFYGVEIRKKLRSIEIDLGFNTVETYNTLIKQLASKIDENVRRELANLRQSFFGDGLNKIEILIQRVDCIIKELQGFRYEK